MSTEEQKAKVRRAIDEAFNKGNLNAMDEIVGSDIVFHQPPMPDVKGLEAYKGIIANIRKIFSDFRFTIDEFIREGDMWAMRYNVQGTHTGQSARLPIPPTGKKVAITGMAMIGTENDKSVKEWDYVDMLGLMQQLGVAPPMGPGRK